MSEVTLLAQHATRMIVPDPSENYVPGLGSFPESAACDAGFSASVETPRKLPGLPMRENRPSFGGPDMTLSENRPESLQGIL